MKNYFIKLALLFITLLFTACSEESVSTSSSSELSVTTQSITLSEKRDRLTIDLIVKNGYDKSIGVELSSLYIAVEPCVVKDVKTTPETILFSNSATQQSLQAQVEFEGKCTPTSFNLQASTKLSLDGKSNVIAYKSPQIEIESSEDDNDSEEPDNSKDYSNYSFYNIPKDINITQPDKEYSFRIQLIDSDKKGVVGESISILAYDINYGDITEMTVDTDSNGFANFIFTSTKSLGELDGQSLELKMVAGQGISKLSATLNLLFNLSSGESSEGDSYTFKNETHLTIEQPNKEYDISIDLINNSGVGVSGKEITITTIERKFGSISSSTAQTDEAGKAQFAYTSPSDIETIDNQSTTVILSFTENDINIQKSVTINFKNTIGSNIDNTLPVVVIPNELQDAKLTSNSQNLEIPIKVFKDITPYTTGRVNVELPSKVLRGVDVGSFSAFSVPVNEQGVAIFNYTGPSNLKALIDNGDMESIFKFYHSENSATENREEMKISYDPSADTYIPIDYALSITTQDNDFSMRIPELQKTFSVLIKDTKGNIIRDSDINITRVFVQTQNTLIARIFDTESRTLVDSLELHKVNSSPFILKSKKLSGIVPLKVIVDFVDINNESKTLSTIINIRVMSGPPSAISISYVSTGQDKPRAKYEEKFAVSVTDEYGNRVNTQPYISLGAIVGYAVDGRESSSVETSNTKRLFYGKSDIDNGTANGAIDNRDDTLANTTYFKDTTTARLDVFQWVNAEGDNTDKLVLFGTGKNYEAMGKWDINLIDSNILNLQDDYFGNNRDKLYYAVGHNYYQDQCLGDGREWIGSTDAENYQLDDEGTVIVSYKYDYHLTGKDALIWVNLNGFQADTGKNTRIGEVTKHTLRGVGLTSIPADGYTIRKETTVERKFFIHHSSAAEWYRNAHFGHLVEPTTCQSYHIVRTSLQYDARTCNNGASTEGVAYVTYQIKAPADADCTFNISDIVVANEF